VTFRAEVTLDVDVEIVDASRGHRGRVGDRPEACYPDEPEEVVLAVRLGGLEITDRLPPDVLEYVRADACERLHEAATEP
jgi:hypothetical protein